jgi:uncharacterized protein (DUF362 family)
MHRAPYLCPRRRFLGLGLAATAGVGAFGLPAAVPNASASGKPKVAIVPCTVYAVDTVKAALRRSFDLVGGISKLVRGKTVTVKINLTGSSFTDYLGRPPGETFMTHFSTAAALAAVLVENGARRVRFVESTNSKATLEATLDLAGWDIKALQALGPVELENTRNLGLGKRYSTLKVGGGGYLFSSFDLNHAYEETDVFVSLAKLKNHILAGVTLTMKNAFGITPNAVYGDEAGSEDATAGRGRLHGPGFLQVHANPAKVELPGLKGKFMELPRDHGYRVPRTVADLCAARPIDLAIIDGITAMDGGEGPWCANVSRLHQTTPGVIILGLNPVSTDAVGAAVMGCADPRAPRGTPPFDHADNHLLLAEQAGLGTADLQKIEVLGQTVAASVCPYKLKVRE